ncbi:MAG: efflux RND transporter periplasmic adaptor subunit [Gemmatimonadaceae bacterium]
MNKRALIALVAAAALAGCQQKKVAPTTVGTVKIERRNITVDATATGAVEPIAIVEVKSKAGGMITKMPVETGTEVKTGALLVQIDTRDVTNQYEQAQADVRSSESQLAVAEAQKKRSDELFKNRVITTTEYETATLQLASAQAGIVRARANLDLAKQRLEDATVVAPSNGTIIERPVSEGMVIAGATGSSASGGTTLLKMADLSKVQIRVLVNETDIGNIRSGQTAKVIVDAYPERPFSGVVEKIEPQAIVQQSVTMFPVIVSLANSDGALKPGMNGEVSMLIEERIHVVAVPNDAVRTLREASTAALLVGLDPDSVSAYVKANSGAGGRGGRGGANATESPTDAPAATSVAAAGAKTTTGGKADSATSGNNGGRRGGMRGGDSTRVAMGGGMGGGRGGQGRMGGRAGQGGGNGRGGNGASMKTAGMSNAMTGGPRVAPRVRSGLVFVLNATGGYEPRVVRLGPSNYDYSEVLSGVQEGETVATLAVAALQAKRDAANDRQRQQQGGGVPGMSRGAAPAAGGGGGRGGAI